ncbi:hypothetical protein O1611_g6732 [Lasiodiplodia mahajangana]|uniref:Uncharacterized protein n=1 Tax=Lasiodiplodia mahajangana TaxID=1108764 RepID=A0ACC2JHG2_9PEZI|nr:hypothetical protein O1611_g6732 [Lasiodiplodia mahajangana]
MATLTIPANWQPSYGCLEENDWWLWGGLPEGAPTVLGNPDQITSCYPPGWAPAATYEATQCPPAFTSACRDGDSQVVTCCPTAQEFACRTTTSGEGLSSASCYSLYAKDIPATVRPEVVFPSNITTSTIVQGSPTEHLFALAILYTEPPKTTLSTALDNPTSPSTPSLASSSKVNVAVVAGASVGAAVGGFVLAFLVSTWVFKRRKHTGATGISPVNQKFAYPPLSRAELEPSHGSSELSSVKPPSELPTY